MNITFFVIVILLLQTIKIPYFSDLVNMTVFFYFNFVSPDIKNAILFLVNKYIVIFFIFILVVQATKIPDFLILQTWHDLFYLNFGSHNNTNTILLHFSKLDTSIDILLVDKTQVFLLSRSWLSPYFSRIFYLKNECTGNI